MVARLRLHQNFSHVKLIAYDSVTGVVRRCWVNFQCRGVLLIWIIVGQGPVALAPGTGGGGLDIFSLVYHFSLLSPPLWETARYRLKYCLKGPLNPNQPTNDSVTIRLFGGGGGGAHVLGNSCGHVRAVS